MVTKKLKLILITALLAAACGMLYATPEIKVQLGHSDTINSVTFSPQGDYFASGSSDNSVRFWDKKTGKEIMKFEENVDSSVNSIVLSSDGKYIFSGLGDSTINMWNIESKNIIKTFKGHSSTIYSLSISKDNKFLISGSGDKTIKMWDTESGKLLKTFIGHSDVVSSVSMYIDGKYLISGSWDKTIKLWDIESGKLLKTLSGHLHWVKCVAISYDSKFILSGSSDCKIKLWDIETGKEIRTFSGHNSHINCIKILSNNNYFLSASSDNTIKYWDLRSGSEIKTFKGHSQSVNTISISSDDKYFITGSEDKLIKLWNIETGKELNYSSYKLGGINSVFVSSDGKFAVVGSDDGVIKYFDTSKGGFVKYFSGHSYSVHSVSLSKDNKYILSSSGDRTLKLWDIETGKILKSIYDNNKILQNPLFSEDEKIIISSTDELIKFWDIKIGKKIKTIQSHNSTIYSLAINGKYLLSGEYDKNIRLFDIESGKELKVFSGHSKYITSVKFSSNKKCVLSSSGDKTIKLWDIETGNEINSFLGHSDAILSVSMSSDNKYILSGGCDNTIKLWDVSSGKEIKTLTGHSGWVSSVSFSPDGKYALSGSRDGTIRYWNTSTGELIYTSISTPDGEYLTWTPEGFFSGSEKLARELVYIVDGMKVIDIAQFYDVFYRPDLVEAKAQGKDISTFTKNINLEKLINNDGLPPVVEFVTESGTTENRDITIKMKVKDIGGGVGKVTVFLDGMPVTISEGGRGLKPSTGKSKTNEVVTEYDYEVLVTLRHGVNNIEFSAYNKNNTIESRKSIIEMVYKSAVVTKPNLYILAIAVNKYRDKSLWLNYSINDADAITETFENQSKTLFQSVNVSKLYDAEVTKEGFEKKFDEISSKISPDDVFILYLAGHGITYEVDGDYYYLPANFRYTDSSDIPKNGISKNMILNNLTKIKAQKSVMLFDTCNSGSFIDKPTTRGVSEKTAVDRLKKAMGRAIIVASSDTQVALEGMENHGVFTYVLLKGLKEGAADTLNKGLITITNLTSFIESEVPDLTYNKWGYEQVPMKELPKEDFPIGMK